MQTSSQQPASVTHSPPDSSPATISLCICTRNRPEDLTRCLESVAQCDTQPFEIIVSDDSTDPAPTQAVTRNYPNVTYQRGPCLGLGPNRNACIRSAQGTHLIFTDDDVCVPADFFAKAIALINQSPEAVITGYEMKHRSWEGTAGTTKKVIPHNADFWGTMHIPIDNRPCCSVVMNSAIFPKSLFTQALFDECLRYGYEELDISRHAVSLGYPILYRDSLYVDHYQSLVDRKDNRRFVYASQLYTTAKAYFYYERSLPKTLTYALLAPLKITGSLVKREGPTAFVQGVKATALAYRYFFTAQKAS